MMLMARITNRTDFTCKLWRVIDTIEVFLNTKNMYFTLKNEIETEASLSVFNQTVIEPTFLNRFIMHGLHHGIERYSTVATPDEWWDFVVDEEDFWDFQAVFLKLNCFKQSTQLWHLPASWKCCWSLEDPSDRWVQSTQPTASPR